jgi:hypothetical protein
MDTTQLMESLRNKQTQFDELISSPALDNSVALYKKIQNKMDPAYRLRFLTDGEAQELLKLSDDKLRRKIQSYNPVDAAAHILHARYLLEYMTHLAGTVLGAAGRCTEENLDSFVDAVRDTFATFS